MALHMRSEHEHTLQISGMHAQGSEELADSDLLPKQRLLHTWAMALCKGVWPSASFKLASAPLFSLHRHGSMIPLPTKEAQAFNMASCAIWM